MTNSLVDDLNKAGIYALPLPAGKPTPSEGWLVRGVFTQVDEGNRMRRAMIGLGAGQTDLQLAVAVDDLSAGIPKPLYQLDTGAESRKLPGAFITLNPYVAAARFVLAGNNLERNVRQAAKKIAADIVARARK